MSNNTPRGVAIVVIRPSLDGPQIAINQRIGTKTFRDFWQTPGGKVDPGETPDEAAVRELREETGFDSDEVWCVWHKEADGQVAYDLSVHVVVLPRGVELKNTEPEKHSDWQWVSIEQAKTKPLIPGLARFFEDLEGHR